MRIPRRTVLMASIGFMLTGRAWGQTCRIPRVGFLTMAPNDQTLLIAAFRSGLSDLGYMEGRNIELKFRFAGGDTTRLGQLASELVSSGSDIIVVDGGSAVPPTMAATRTIPIVMATAGDPIALGYVSSLARPGGNVTGFSLISNELNLKRLDLLRTTFPLAWGITLFLNPLNATAVAGTQAITETAGKLSV
jgi:putative ABC transport system substrate-binding protein